MQLFIFILGFLFAHSICGSSEGSYDTTFNNQGYIEDAHGGCGYGLAVQPDGGIVVVGQSSTNNFFVTRYTSQGAVDTSEFNFPHGYINDTSKYRAYGVAIQPDGKILVIGQEALVDPTGGALYLARYLPNGLLDTVANGGSGFGSGSPAPGYVLDTNGYVGFGLGILSNGKIVVAGQDTTQSNLYIAWYNSDGTLALNYTDINASVPNFNVSAGNMLAIDSNDKAVVTCSDSNGGHLYIARYLPDGNLDTTEFNAPQGYVINSSAVSGNGVVVDVNDNIIVTGFQDWSQFYAFTGRYLANGTLDTTGFNSEGTTGSTSGPGYIIDQNISTSSGSAGASGVTLLPNGDIAIIGGNDPHLVIIQYTAAGNYDTNFGSGGVMVDSNANVGYALALQPNGKLVATGFGGGAYTARYNDQTGIQGCIDVTYNSSGSNPGYVTDITDPTAADMPEIVALQALSTGSTFMLTKNIAGTPATQLIQLDASGSATSSNAIAPITLAQPGGADVIVDSHARALVVGTNGTPNGWIARYIPTAGTPGSFSFDTSFNNGSTLIQSSAPVTTAFSRVCEQQSGNILVMGQNGTTGIIVAYNQDGTINTNFGSSGQYIIANSTLTDMVVDTQDRIYLVGGLNAGNIQLYRILADGSALDPNFNSGVAIDTGWTTALYGSAKLGAISSSGMVTVAAIENASAAIHFAFYTSAGSVDSPATYSIAQTTSLFSSPVLTQMQLDSENQPVFVGYDDYYFYVGRLTSSLTLDTVNFAPYPSSVTAGILKLKYDDNNDNGGLVPQRAANCLTINSNGALIFGGYENITSSSTISVVGNVVGDQITPATLTARYPGADIGGINSNFGSSGELLLSSVSSVGSVQAMYVLSNGKILNAVKDGSNTILAQLTSGYVLDTASFGSGTGKVTLTGLSNPKQIMIDLLNNIYVLGDNGSNMMLFKVTPSGAISWSISGSSTTLTTGNTVLEQTSGRIIVAGLNNSGGVIVGLNPNTGAIDFDFGTLGYYQTQVSSQIAAAAINSNDMIVFAYNDAGNATLRQIYSNGSGIDTSFVFGTALTGVAADNQIKMQLDSTGKIVVIIRDTTGNFVASRYTNNGADNAGPTTITLTNQTTTSLEEILCVSNQTTFFLGSNSNGSTLILGRLNASFALDTNFNYPNGIFQSSVPSMTKFYACDVVQDQTILVAGASNTPLPYLTDLFNDYVVTKVNQNTSTLAVAGTLDTTYNPTGVNTGYLNMHTELGATQLSVPNKVKTVLQKADYSYYIAATDGVNSYITYFSADDIQQSSFGSSGVLTIAGYPDISAMMIDQNGYLVVVGGNGSSGSGAGWIQQYNASTGVATSFAATTRLDVCTSIVEQTDGRYIVAGKVSGHGTLIAYNSVTGAVDTTWSSNGLYNTSYTNTVTSIAIDPQNHIYIIVNDVLAATTKKLSVGGSSVVWTGSSTIANALNSSNHLAIDQNGNIVIATVDNSGAIFINRYDGTTGSLLASLSLIPGITGFTTPNITNVLIDATVSSPGNIILVGYDTGTSGAFVMRVLADLSDLDATFNPTGFVAGIQILGVPTATVTSWNAGFIDEEGKILVAGYATVSSVDTPYTMRLYGNDFIGQYVPTISAGTSGTIDTNFGTSGYVALSGIGAGTPFADATPLVILPISSGSYYIAFDNGKLARMTNDNVLDTTFNASGTTNIAGLAVNDLPIGTFSMMFDGSNRLVVAGTDEFGHGWVQRYLAGDSGTLDTTFNTTGKVDLGASTVATIVVEQTLGRVVVAGKNSSGNGALFGFTENGQVELLFGTNGVFDTQIPAGIYGFTCDQYDRLIIGMVYSGSAYVSRLTSAGQKDITFGYAYNSILNTINGGAGILQNADIEQQIRVVLDSTGNIVIAAHQHTASDFIAVIAYDNGTSISNNSNGITIMANEYDLTALTNPTLTDLITTADGKVLVAGNQNSGGSGYDVDMWVARVFNNAGSYAIDTTFNPGGLDLGQGIMNFSFYGGSNPRVLSSIAIYGDGQIYMAGAETAVTPQPFIACAYDQPYTSQIVQSPNARAIGTNDLTLGVGLTSSIDLGVTFFASSTADASSGQVAQAIALPTNNQILVAVDGGALAGSTTPSQLFLQQFNIDGIPDTTFGTSGQQTVLSIYENQHVRDMLTFTTPSGVVKAILAGYANSTSLSAAGSLLVQYNLTTKTLDASFGGFDGNPAGVAFGDGQQAWVVGQQTMGRIIVGGLTQGGAGLLLGYSANGKLDTTFGNDGYQSTNTGSTGIYTHTIDTENRIIIAYNDGSGNVVISRFLADGSALDTTFGTAGSVTTQIS
ncbi:MAG: hypothetical protein ACXWL5_02855, partial [Candidatus Chromulinivorax sp.]